MNPLVFIASLLFYSEGSSCRMTRSVGRVILYTYLMSLVISMYVVSLNLALMLCLLCYLISYLYCYLISSNVYSKVISVTLAVSVTIFYMVLLENNLTSYPKIIQDMLSYSNYIYRDGTLALISSISLKYYTTKDNLINFMVCVMWTIEKSITII